MIRLKRVYENPSPEDGKRFLVERLWPRGIRKDDLKMDAWLKEVAPSTGLRQWFGHDPAKWQEFRRRYEAELEKNADRLQPLIDGARAGAVTLLFSSRDAEHNNAVALREFLEARIHARTSHSGQRSS